MKFDSGYEGNSFARSENRMLFYAFAEQFLLKYLDGSFEPISDEELEGANFEYENCHTNT